MSPDPWSAWQAAAALWMPPGASAAMAGTAPGAAGAMPFAGFAERFQAAARAFLDAATAAGSASPPSAASAESFVRFLREQFASLRPPWGFEAPGAWPDGAGASQASGSPGQAAAWAVGAGREHQQRLERLAAAAGQWLAARQRLELLWTDALREAAVAYVGQVSAEAPKGAGPDLLESLYDRWIDCAEDAYGRMAHSEVYCDTLAECVNAGSRWRNELQAGLEQWAKLLDLPTRSEINSLEQRLRELEQAQVRPGASDQGPGDRPAKRRGTGGRGRGGPGQRGGTIK